LAVGREHFSLLFPLALIVGLIQAIIVRALGGNDVELGADTVSTTALIGVFVSLIPAVVFLGLSVELLRDVRAGRDARTAGELVGSVLPIALPLLSLALFVAAGTVAGLFLLVVPGLLLATIWAVVLPVFVIERPALLASFGRSRELVRGHGWPVFGTLMLLLLVALVGAILATIVAVDPASIVGSFVQLLVSSLVTPVTTLLLAALYFRLVDLHGPVADQADGEPAQDAPVRRY
ncbi:MAG: hypothetical protein ITG02_06850, partial [Patulibacter sp.]|nr:hypothetical protein [Patulibacter sp.]